jgi:hypothetical protein
MDTKKPYEHLKKNGKGYYYPIQFCLSRCWKATTPEFKKVWKELQARRYDDNFKFEETLVNAHDLFCRVVFLSCTILGCDLENLTPNHWLTCVITVRDLLDSSDMIYYGLSDEELGVRIFEHCDQDDNEDCMDEGTVIEI